MTSFLHWRKMTWALVLWSAYLATWMVLTRSGPVIVVLWWLAGAGLLQLIIMHWGRSSRHADTAHSVPASARDPSRRDYPARTATWEEPPSRPAPEQFEIRRKQSRTGKQRAAQSQSHPKPTRRPRLLDHESRMEQETRRMSNLIAKIRHLLHLDTKPKTLHLDTKPKT